MSIPFSGELKAFCQLDCNRFEFLTEWLREKDLPHSVLEQGDFRHILITPGGADCYRKDSRNKILIAHYDRVPETPGANDNSASVFQLLQFCLDLQQGKRKHNCLIILSDGEELQQKQSIREQGAWQLAQTLKAYSFQNSLVLIMDLCGIGDTLVYGSSGDRAAMEKNRNIPPGLEELLDRYSRGEGIKQIQYFSDDIGFLAHSFSTVLLSVLPWKEKKSLEENIMPPSWSTQHTMEDSVEKLEGRAFRIMGSFLHGIADLYLSL